MTHACNLANAVAVLLSIHFAHNWSDPKPGSVRSSQFSSLHNIQTVSCSPVPRMIISKQARLLLKGYEDESGHYSIYRSDQDVHEVNCAHAEWLYQ